MLTNATAVRAASKVDGLLSVYASLNDGPPLVLGSGGELPSLLGRPNDGATRNVLQLPPESYGFATYAGASLSACAR